MEIDSKYLTSSAAMINNFVLELTDKCNLRCVYCHQNLPDYVAKRYMTDQMVTRIMEYFDREKPPFINLTGGGDMLMAPEWDKQCERMLEYGIPLRATVNLGKVLSKKEAEVLARFSLLTVSIDTVDPQLLKQYRKAVDIRTISTNILMIKSAALRLDIREPELIISAVYYAEIAPLLEDVVTYAYSVGASIFGLQDLLEYENIQNNVTPVWKLQGDAALPAIHGTRKALAMAEKLGLTLNLPGDFVSRLDQLESSSHVPIAA